MATNLAIDPELLDRATKLGGLGTKKATVTVALNEFIARRAQREILELVDSIEWDPDYNYKAERSR